PWWDTAGEFADLGQSGPVWFLAGGAWGYTKNVTVPAGKALFFPLIDVIDDYPCPLCAFGVPFQPDPGQSLDNFLTYGTSSHPEFGARFYVNWIDGLAATVDGVALRNLFDYRATSPLFYF